MVMMAEMKQLLDHFISNNDAKPVPCVISIYSCAECGKPKDKESDWPPKNWLEEHI